MHAGIQRQYLDLYRAFNPKLVELLPLQDPGFRAVLYKEDLISDDFKEQLRNAKDSGRKENNEHFLSTVIYRALITGNVDPFKCLLQVMEDFDDRLLERLAQEMNNELSRSVTMNPPSTLEDSG